MLAHTTTQREFEYAEIQPDVAAKIFLHRLFSRIANRTFRIIEIAGRRRTGHHAAKPLLPDFGCHPHFKIEIFSLRQKLIIFIFPLHKHFATAIRNADQDCAILPTGNDS